MNAFRPTVPKFLFFRPTPELKPGLIDVVAQLVGSGHPDQYRRTVGDQAEAFLALAPLKLRSTTSLPLPDQPKNEQGFEQDQRDTANDVPLVALPNASLAEPNNCSRRQSLFVESPALHLPPIDHRNR